MKLTHKPPSIYTHPTLTSYEFSRMDGTFKAFKIAALCMVAVPVVMVGGIVVYGAKDERAKQAYDTYGSAASQTKSNKRVMGNPNPSYSDWTINATDRETVEYRVE